MSGMDVFQALADPTRREILSMLSGGERSAGELRPAFAMTPTAVSQHLRVLRRAGLVRVRGEAQRRFYSLRREGLAETAQWLSGLARQTDPPRPVAVPAQLSAYVQARRLGLIAA